MNKVEFALRLAKDCTYADLLTDGAKEHLRKVIDEALEEIKKVQSDVKKDELKEESESTIIKRCPYCGIQVSQMHTNCPNCDSLLMPD